MVNTAPTYIAMIEAERRTPSFKMIERLATALNIDAPELFSLKNYPAESVTKLNENLMHEFDKFLRSAARDAAEKNQSP